MNETIPPFSHERVDQFVARDKSAAIEIYNLLNQAVKVHLGRELEFRPDAEMQLHQDPGFADLLSELGISHEAITPCFINAIWIAVRNALVAKR